MCSGVEQRLQRPHRVLGVVRASLAHLHAMPVQRPRLSVGSGPVGKRSSVPWGQQQLEQAWCTGDNKNLSKNYVVQKHKICPIRKGREMFVLYIIP